MPSGLSRVYRPQSGRHGDDIDSRTCITDYINCGERCAHQEGEVFLQQPWLTPELKILCADVNSTVLLLFASDYLCTV